MVDCVTEDTSLKSQTLKLVSLLTNTEGEIGWLLFLHPSVVFCLLITCSPCTIIIFNFFNDILFIYLGHGGFEDQKTPCGSWFCAFNHFRPGELRSSGLMAGAFTH